MIGYRWRKRNYNALPPSGTYLEDGTWFCTSCHHPVAAHFNGRCRMVGLTQAATIFCADVKDGACLCNQSHGIFAEADL